MPEGKIEKLRWYDVQLSFTFNPLNWQLGSRHFGKGIAGFDFGPFRVMLYFGG